MLPKLINHLLLLQITGILCAGLPTIVLSDEIPQQTALIVRGIDQQSDKSINQIFSMLQSIGYKTEIKNIEALTDMSSSYSLIVLRDASSLPLDSIDFFHKHFHEGGDLIALKAPMWQKQLIRKENEWIDRDTYLESKPFDIQGDELFDFSKDNPNTWTRDTSQPETGYSWNNVIEKSSGRTVLGVKMDNLEGHEFMTSPKLDNPFKTGSSLTIITAKGSSQTTQLVIRWMEKDGSNWISTIPVSEKWRRYILRPSDFKWGGGNQEREKSTFDPQNADRLSIGLSWNDTGLRGGSKEFMIGGVYTAIDSTEYKHLYGGHLTMPDFDSLSPTWKLFKMNDTTKLISHPAQNVITAGMLSTPVSVMSPYQRPQGNGYDKGREWRWIPLIQGQTKGGTWRGNPAVLTIFSTGWVAGSAWASFGIQDENWYDESGSIQLINDAIKIIHDGLFIMDGGADLYTYTEKQSVKLGLNVANISSTNKKNLKAIIYVINASTGEQEFTKSWNFNLDRSSNRKFEEEWKPKSWPAKGFKISVELIDGTKVTDRVGHDIYLDKPKKQKNYLSIKDGEFWLKGKPWRINGVNYHPSSTLATADWGLFLEWFGKRSYDPDVIEKDLQNMKKMGINAVSIQLMYSKSPKADNLRDFLRRLDKFGIKANLALPLAPMTELETRWDVYKDVIKDLNLKEIDTIIGYDIDWEPTWLTTDYRKQWDKEWAAWIIERYGSFENAEKDWGMPVPRDNNGEITNPTVQQTQSDGEWRKLTSAYRRFLNTILYRQYSKARRLIRELDQNHPVSFRMHAAGDGGSGWYGLLPYDWSYLAAAVDFFGPEAYSLGKNWESYVKRGLYTSAYGDWADKNKPVIYAETGFSLYEYPDERTPRIDAEERQSIFYKDFYQMIREGSINGVYWWWYPGGFRFMENSDYGVINPDGSDRLVTKLIRKYSKEINKPSSLKQGKTYSIDPEAYISSSEAGNIYDQMKKDFWKDIENGYMPKIDSPGRGTDSSNCPLVAVGNSPYNGNNPPKHLDAWIDVVEILDAEGKWKKVKNGEEIDVDTQKPVYIRTEITNLGDAKWLAGQDTGCVSVIISGDISSQMNLQIDVPRLNTTSTGPHILLSEGKTGEYTINLHVEAKDRARFGNRFTFKIK